jgi:hypothetical protein
MRKTPLVNIEVLLLSMYPAVGMVAALKWSSGFAVILGGVAGVGFLCSLLFSTWTIGDRWVTFPRGLPRAISRHDVRALVLNPLGYGRVVLMQLGYRYQVIAVTCDGQRVPLSGIFTRHDFSEDLHRCEQRLARHGSKLTTGRVG